MNGNMGSMYYTEINFLTQKIECKLWKINFSSEGNRLEIYRLANLHRYKQNFSNTLQGCVHVFEVYII